MKYIYTHTLLLKQEGASLYIKIFQEYGLILNYLARQG